MAPQGALANILGIMGMSSSKTEVVRQAQTPSVSLLEENNYTEVWEWDIAGHLETASFKVLSEPN